MKKLLTTIFFVALSFNSLAQYKAEIAPYVDYLNNNKLMSAKDYIISKFQDHDIVVLCERHHSDMAQYDMILDVMRDPYFADSVGAVFTEVGWQGMNPGLNIFLKGCDLPEKEINDNVLHFHRLGNAYPWNRTNYSYLIRGIYDINRTLPESARIGMYPTDVMNFEGELTTEEQCRKQLAAEDVRDSLMAGYIVDIFDLMKKSNPRAKALVIMNFRHAYRLPVLRDGSIYTENVGWYLNQKYGEKVAYIKINNVGTFSGLPEQDGKWDAAFKVTQKEDVGFDLAGTPFGEDILDDERHEPLWKYGNMFDGYVFYTPIEKFRLSHGVEGLMDDETAAKTLDRIWMLLKMEYGDEISYEEEKEYFKSLNEVEVFEHENLDSVKKTIDKWIEE